MEGNNPSANSRNLDSLHTVGLTKSHTMTPKLDSLPFLGGVKLRLIWHLNIFKYSNGLRRLNIDAFFIAKKKGKVNWETLRWSVIVTLINDWGNSLPTWASA